MPDHHITNIDLWPVRPEPMGKTTHQRRLPGAGDISLTAHVSDPPSQLEVVIEAKQEQPKKKEEDGDPPEDSD